MNRLSCPKCKNQLSPLTQEADLIVDRCETCKGVWMDKGELERISGSDLSEEIYNHGPFAGKTCPKCQVKMREVVIPTKSKLIIDVCGQCSGLWFDARELAQVQNFLRVERIRQKKGHLAGN